MFRLRKKIIISNLGQGWGELIVTYRNNGLGFITYDDINNAFWVFVNISQTPPNEPQEFIPIYDMKKAFEEAELYIINFLKSYGSIDKIKTKNPPGFNIDSSTQWEQYLNGKQDDVAEEQTEKVEKDYKTIEFHFFENDTPIIENLITQLIKKDLLDNYSISPFKTAKKHYLFKNVLGILERLYKPNRRLRKTIYAYNYNDVLEYITDHFIKDFYYNIDICSIYFNDNTDNENSYYAKAFIVKYKENFILFGATSENDILNIQERLSIVDNQYEDGYNNEEYIGYSIDRFIQELKQSPMGSIVLFNNFESAEQYVLNEYIDIKQRIVVNSNYENTTSWQNFEQQFLQENVEYQNENSNNNTVEKQPVMRLRIHYDPKIKNKNNPTEKFIQQWLDNNQDVVFNAYQRIPV